MARRPPKYVADPPTKKVDDEEVNAQSYSQKMVEIRHYPTLEEMIAASGVPKAEVANRIGISPRSLRYYLAGAPLPMVVAKALDGFALIVAIQRIIDTTPPSRHVPVGKLRALDPALAKRSPLHLSPTRRSSALLNLH